MGRVALVTGANQGLGLALVEGLARQLGPDDVVYLTGRNAERVRTVREHVTGACANVRTCVLDVGDGAGVAMMAERLRAEHGGVDIVFSNHYLRTMPEDVPADIIDSYVDVNQGHCVFARRRLELRLCGRSATVEVAGTGEIA